MKERCSALAARLSRTCHTSSEMRSPVYSSNKRFLATASITNTPTPAFGIDELNDEIRLSSAKTMLILKMDTKIQGTIANSRKHKTSLNKFRNEQIAIKMYSHIQIDRFAMTFHVAFILFHHRQLVIIGIARHRRMKRSAMSTRQVNRHTKTDFRNICKL